MRVCRMRLRHNYTIGLVVLQFIGGAFGAKCDATVRSGFKT